MKLKVTFEVADNQSAQAIRDLVNGAYGSFISYHTIEVVK